ncbi:hypothetical protein [Streptomyces sp. NPDC096012]|uniref:hypothetical protein n=1 Tax=Streptomyces sp. NPDC096012 TaxID=3155684 RepID=UPI003369D462
MSTGPGRSRRVRPAVLGAVAALALLVPVYAAFVPAAFLRTEARGAEPAEATFHDGVCFLGGCRVTFSEAGEDLTAGLPFGTRARGRAEGDTGDVLHVPGEPDRVALADDSGRGSVAALLAVPAGATVLAVSAGAVLLLRERRSERPARAA